MEPICAQFIPSRMDCFGESFWQSGKGKTAVEAWFTSLTTLCAFFERCDSYRNAVSLWSR